MVISQEDVDKALATVVDPQSQRPLSTTGYVKQIHVAEGHVTLTLLVPSTVQRHDLGARIREKLEHVEIRWEEELGGRTLLPDDPLPEVKHIVAVMSGKGGVGKSSIATNLALALARAGYRVGLLDADIYGPSIPTMLGVSGRPVSLDGKLIEPLTRFGLKLMSIGFLLEDPKAAVIWRGPMLHGALQQFMKDVHWGPLDFVVLDLPPGTGDVALTLSQKVKVTGAVVVTTPQAVATDDVFKSISMCRKVNIPILGVVENMSYFIDSAGVRHELFGKGGGAEVAAFAEAPLLAQVPLDPKVREWADKGTPVVQADPASAIAGEFVALAERVVDAAVSLADDGASFTIDRSGGSGKKRLPIAR